MIDKLQRLAGVGSRERRVTNIARQSGHEHRCGHPLPGHIADRDDDSTVGYLEKSVVVSSAALRRLVLRGEVVSGNLGERNRQELLLDLPGELEFPTYALLAHDLLMEA